MTTRRNFGLLGAGTLAIGSLLASGIPVLAAGNATATLTGCAGVGFGPAPAPTATYPITLDGTNVASTPVSMSFDISDCTGLGNGWNVTAQQNTAGNFIDGAAHTLQNPAGNAIGTVTNGSRPAAACDLAVSCTVAVAGGSPISYSGALAFGTTSGNKIYQAAASSGQGNQTFALNVGIGTIKADSFAATYNATWTFSLVSGP